jgi:hypothetical protein
METILKIVKQERFDRYVFLTYSDDKIIGLNYHQGIDKILYDWATPCPALTDIFERYAEKYTDLNWQDTVNDSIYLYEQAFLWQQTNIILPNSQKKIIQKALKYYLKQYKTFNQMPTDTEEYEMFDLMTLKALFNYDVEIKLNKNEAENFTQMNGIDLPNYN